MSHFQCGDHGQRTHQVRQQFAHQDVRRRRAERLGCGDEFGVAQLLRRRARNDREAVPQQQAEQHDHHLQRAADQRRHRQRDQHHRHREPRRDDVADDRIDTAAVVAGQHAERGADDAGDDGRDDADDQRHAGAEQQPAQVVAAELVGAQDVFPAALVVPDRRDQAARHVLRIRIVRREPRREDRGQHDQAEDDGADGEAVLAEHAAQQLAPCGRRRQRQRRFCGHRRSAGRSEGRGIHVHLLSAFACAGRARRSARPPRRSGRCRTRR